jgi:hypothetical protein
LTLARRFLREWGCEKRVVVEPAPLLPAATMKPTPFSPCRFFATGLCAFLAWGQPALFAATAASTPPGGVAGPGLNSQFGSSLVIANGKIDSYGPPATLNLVVARLAQRYPAESIIIGAHAGEVIIPDLTIHFGGESDLPQMMDYLQAIVAAVGGDLVLTADYSNAGPYTISRRVSASAQAPKHIAVFNLGPAQATGQLDYALEAELAKAQLELSALTTTHGLNHPEVLAKNNEIQQLQMQIVQRKNDLLRQNDVHIEQIKDILAQTLDSLGLNENVGVQFHSGANLLIVTGSDEALDVATKIVTAMGGTPGSELAPNTPPSLAASYAAAFSKMVEHNRLTTATQNPQVTNQLAFLRARLAELKAIYLRSKADYDANPSPEKADAVQTDAQNLDKVQTKVAELEQLDRLQVELPRTQSQLDPTQPQSLAPSPTATQSPPAQPQP